MCCTALPNATFPKFPYSSPYLQLQLCCLYRTEKAHPSTKMNSSWCLVTADIDNEILELENRILELKWKRNSVVPITQLPNEILAQILLYVQLDWGYNDNYETLLYHEDTGMDHDWTRSMLVCRRFRDAALACPLLWSYIDLTHKKKEWISLSFQRSKGCLLDVYAVMTHKNLNDVSYQIEDLIRRSLHLRLCIKCVHKTEQAKAWRSVQALTNLLPMLVSLHLYNETSSRNGIFGPHELKGISYLAHRHCVSM
jgi:hypothetical protein